MIDPNHKGMKCVAVFVSQNQVKEHVNFYNRKINTLL